MSGRLINNNDKLNTFLDSVNNTDISEYVRQWSIDHNIHYEIDEFEKVWAGLAITGVRNFVFEQNLSDVDSNYGGRGLNINGSFGTGVFEIHLLHLLMQNLMNKSYSESNLKKLELYKIELKKENDSLNEIIDWKIFNFEKDDIQANLRGYADLPNDVEEVLNKFLNFVKEYKLGVCSFQTYKILTSNEHKGKSKKEIQLLYKGLERQNFKNLYGDSENFEK